MHPDHPLEPTCFGVILDCIADGVFTVDQRWRVTFFNRAAEQITGIASQEAVGQPCSEVLRANICSESCALRHSMLTGQQLVD